MPETTIAFSASGWSSRFSFSPEAMVSLNNRFFSAKKGALWMHNSSDDSKFCNFYGTDYDHSIEFVLNDSASVNKVFKTISLDSTIPYDTLVKSDIETSGFINSDWYEEREGGWYGFIRNTGSTPAGEDEYVLTRLKGIGFLSSVSGASSSSSVAFALEIDLGNAAIGDNVYHFESPYETPVYSGVITDIVVDKPSGVNKIVVDSTVSGATVAPSGDTLIAVMKNSYADSHGVLGAYAKVTLTGSNNSSLSEIYSVSSDVMRSQA